LQTSNSDTSRFYYVLVALWLICMVAGFSYLVAQRLVTFDPNFTLLNSPQKHILGQLKQYQSQPIALTIFHFFDDSCHCTKLTAEHRAAIDKVAKQDGFSVVYVDIEGEEGMSDIPASPAILITDAQSELLYVGPYATGIDCSANNSLIDVVLNNYRQGFSAPTIVSDAKGCYCQR